MEATDKVFAGPIPELYDRLLVPLIFQVYADDVARRIAALHPVRLLEVAAGTGALTRALAARLAPDARIVATDLNPAMLERAATHAPDDRISWQPADGQALPFGDGAFDVVACQFGVMFFPDRVQGYREALRVLKPGGRYFLTVWDRITENEFVNVIEAALAARFPADPPRFMSRTPHGHFDVERIRRELTEAGFRDITIETVPATSHGRSAQEVAFAYCQGTPLRPELEARAPGGLDATTQAVTGALAARFGTGPIEGRIQAIVVSAVR